MINENLMCPSAHNEPGTGSVLVKLEELHSFKEHPFKLNEIRNCLNLEEALNRREYWCRCW